MDDGTPDDQTQALDVVGEGGDTDFDGAGAPRGPRQAAEGVRIIGAEEAAAAIEAGQVAGRRPDDAPRFGDVPEPPSGPRPSLRFPGADPQTVLKPPVAGPPPRTPAAAAGAPPPPPPPPPDMEASEAEQRFWSDDADAAPVDVEPAWSGSGPIRADVAGSAPVGTAGHYADPTMSSGAGDDRTVPAPGEPEFWDDAAEAARPDPSPRFGTFDNPEDSGSMPLPHWTEPPSGEVPRILPGAEGAPPADDDLRAWSSLSTGPRWRDQHTDWDEADFGDEMLDDPEMRVGALRASEGDDDDLGAEAPFPEPPARRAPPPPGPARSRRRGPTPPAGPRQAAPARNPSEATGAPRDLTTSVVTGAVAFAVVLLAALIGPKALVVLVSAALVVAAGELFQAMRSRGYHPATLLGVVGTAALSGAVYWRGIDGFHLVLPLFMVFALLWSLLGVSAGRPLMSVASTVLGFFYVGILGSFAALLLTAPSNHGIGLLLGAVIATATYDAAAYLAGRSFGHTPLMPDVSPGKTVEGMVGACLATLVVCGVVVGQIAPWTPKRAIVLALVTIVVAPLGDLCESMLKRDLGVKDMGSILPGHGGVLDRIDALLFVVPATYYVMRLLKFA
jgi:phosphatidate cytidylyltransferase